MLSPELHRLCAALTGDCTGLELDEPRQLQLVHLARRHRVDPYLHVSTPEASWHKGPRVLLADGYRRNAQRVLIAQSWTERLIAHLAQHDIEARPLKGLPLAAQAYARPSDRHSGDIDLLLPDVAKRGTVTSLLEEAGMRRKARSIPQLRPVRRYLAKTDEFLSADGQRLEVHYQNHREGRAIFPATLRFDSDAWEPTAIGRTTTHRLQGTVLTLYLLSHGLRQGWLRLKWLLDVSRLTAAYDERQWSDLRTAAANARMSLEYRTGIGLLHQTLGKAPAPLQGHTRATITRTICLRWLNEPREPTELIALKFLKPPYKMLALPGFWPRFSYLSSLVLR